MVVSGRALLCWAILCACEAPASRADGTRLYGIHWWGYSPGATVDTTPATLLDSVTHGGWDVETVLTHSASWWTAAHFRPLYQDLYQTKNVTIITRIDYDWGQTVPSPTNPDCAGWPAAVAGVVNTLRGSAHLWIIGNEPNVNGEGSGWPNNQVTPAGYAAIYRTVRQAIHTTAGPSPTGPHRVLIAPVSPGGVIPGVRWMSGTEWLAQVIDKIPAAEIDGFALHSYGGSVAEFRRGYTEQLHVIDSRGFTDKPVYMTEWNRYATPGSDDEEAAAAQFCRDAFADVNAWNQGPCNHNIVSLCWFVYDADQQAGGGWNGFAIEYWKTQGDPAGHMGDLFTAFGQTVDLRYPAGAIGTPSPATGGMVDAPPTGANIAIGVRPAVDSHNLSSQAGDKAVDGIVSSASKWVSANTPPPHWLTLDLGAWQPVSGFVLRHAGDAGEARTFNTRTFKIQSANSPEGPWVDETVVCNTQQDNVSARRYPASKPLRHVRLYILDPGADNFARIPEFEVWASPVPPPIAGFSGSPVNGRLPLTVKFSDSSAGSITGWRWSFGDGGTSTERSPAYTYRNAGGYTVSLTATGPGGSDTSTRDAYVNVLPLGADFDGDGDVDQEDFAHLQLCLSGTSLPQNEPACANARLDEDADVDADDFRLFQECMSGAGIAASSNCRSQ